MSEPEKKKKKGIDRQTIPIYAVGVTWLVYGLRHGLHSLRDFIVCGLLSALAFVLPGFSALAAAVPNSVYNAVEWLLSRISLLPYSKLAAFRPSAISCILALLLLFSTSAYVLRPAKTRAKYGACVLLLFTASVFADIIWV